MEAHILTAVMEAFGMASIEDNPSSLLFPGGCADLDPRLRRDMLIRGIKKVLDPLVDVSFPTPATAPESYHVHAYAREVLSLGLLYLKFSDAIREGDGDRILRCWRYFLPLFKATNRTNYSVEEFTMLAQCEFIFTPRMIQQLLWSRTVNTQGRPGKNIPCDLHTEHINRDCKKAIGSVGPNVTQESSITHVGRSNGELSKLTSTFERSNGVPQESGRHTRRSVAKDMEKVL